MNDEQLRAAYQKSMRRARDRAACPTPEQLAAVVDGSAAESERLVTLRHVAGCADCRADLEILRTAGDVAQRAFRPWWQGRPVLALAAALVVMVGGLTLLRQPGGSPGGDIVRDGPGASVTLVAPAESAIVTLPLHLVWARVPGAVRYEVEVIDSAEAVVVSAATTDTTILIADARRLTPDGAFRWWVRAVATGGTQPRSTLRRFRLAANP